MAQSMANTLKSIFISITKTKITSTMRNILSKKAFFCFLCLPICLYFFYGSLPLLSFLSSFYHFEKGSLSSFLLAVPLSAILFQSFSLFVLPIEIFSLSIPLTIDCFEMALFIFIFLAHIKIFPLSIPLTIDRFEMSTFREKPVYDADETVFSFSVLKSNLILR
jgi:hypothetical protein